MGSSAFEYSLSQILTISDKNQLNQLGGIQKLVKSLESENSYSTIQSLVLSSLQIGPDGAQVIGQFLITNSSLKTLYLGEIISEMMD
jgi:hypothetical protein